MQNGQCLTSPSTSERTSYLAIPYKTSKTLRVETELFRHTPLFQQSQAGKLLTMLHSPYSKHVISAQAGLA